MRGILVFTVAGLALVAAEAINLRANRAPEQAVRPAPAAPSATAPSPAPATPRSAAAATGVRDGVWAGVWALRAGARAVDAGAADAGRACSGARSALTLIASTATRESPATVNMSMRRIEPLTR